MLASFCFFPQSGSVKKEQKLEDERESRGKEKEERKNCGKVNGERMLGHNRKTKREWVEVENG